MAGSECQFRKVPNAFLNYTSVDLDVVLYAACRLLLFADSGDVNPAAWDGEPQPLPPRHVCVG